MSSLEISTTNGKVAFMIKGMGINGVWGSGGFGTSSVVEFLLKRHRG